MRSNYILYCSIWCPLKDVRECINRSQVLFKNIMDYVKDYNNDEGIIFLELTEEALKNLPVLMVDNMKCFTQDNMDTMVFSIKEIRCKEERIENLKNFFEESLLKLSNFGFKGELIIIKEVKKEEDNIGKKVGKKDYEIWYHKTY